MDPAAPSRMVMHGLLLPPPVSLWPATPACYLLGAVLLLALLRLGWRGWRAWCRNAYRRAALRSLQAADDATEMAAILKPTALAAWPRARVASLAGEEWAAFLRRSAPRARLTEATASALAQLAYAPGPDPALREAARRWIRLHDPRA
jgi:Ca-activated chloride channel family protein